MIRQKLLLALAIVLLFGTVEIQCEEQEEDDEVFPDMSCHPGFNVEKYAEMHSSNLRTQGAGPNTPVSQNETYEKCPDFNMIFVEFQSNTFDMMDYEPLKIGDANCDENFIECNKKYWFKDSSEKLREMFGEELADEWMKEIKEDCQPILNRVFFEEGKLCSDDEADEIFDCVNHAIGCSDQDWVPKLPIQKEEVVVKKPKPTVLPGRPTNRKKNPEKRKLREGGGGGGGIFFNFFKTLGKNIEEGIAQVNG